MSKLPQLQTNNKTFLGRHFSEFSVLRRYFESDEKLRILSFGCSTGEELLLLHALFPNAALCGCDVDWYNLQSARSLVGRRAVVFDSSKEAIEKHGPFDLIVCNSVLLRHTATVGQKKTGIDPKLWSDVIHMLDDALRKGGIMQIIASNIAFRYHAVASKYQVLRSPLIFSSNFIDQFDLEGMHLATGVPGAGWSTILTRHLGEAAWPRMRPEDLLDIHFRKQEDLAPISPVMDEQIPNFPGGPGWASGTSTYRPNLTDDSRPSTHTEVDVTWTALAVDSVRIQRVANRVWFDGKRIQEGSTTVEMYGPTASAFIESMTGRRSSRISLESLLTAQAIRPPAI